MSRVSKFVRLRRLYHDYDTISDILLTEKLDKGTQDYFEKLLERTKIEIMFYL